MKVTYCPYCLNTTIVEDRAWGGMVQCEAPGCERFFATVKTSTPSSAPLFHTVPDQLVTAPLPVSTYGPTGPAPVREPVPIPRDDLPRLTGPHPCHNCNGMMTEPFGLRRATVVHHNPTQQAVCRTDVYSAIYHCPGCLTLLETPSNQWGTQVACPAEACRHVFTAPRDDLLHERAGDAKEGVPIDFPCPACGAALRCDTQRDGKPTTGHLAACLACRHVISLPASGERPR